MLETFVYSPTPPSRHTFCVRMSEEGRLRKVFVKQKVAVSYAVTKLFPLLHGLVDHNIISKKMFTQLKQQTNPVSEVVYELLSYLEKKTLEKIQMFLKQLFDNRNLQVYPDLKELQPKFSEFMTASGATSSLTVEKTTNYELPSEPCGNQFLETPQKRRKKYNSCKKKIPLSKKDTLGGKRKKCLECMKKSPLSLQKSSPTQPHSTQKASIDPKVNALRRKTWISSGVNLQSPELPVTCGNKQGILHKKKLISGPGSQCIFADGHWFSPNDFQRFGGRKLSKNWKKSIFCETFTLAKLIELKYLQPRQASYTLEHYYHKASRKQDSSSATPSTSKDQSLSTTRNCSQSTPKHSPGVRRFDVELNDAQMTLFSSNKFPVACGLVSGELHKCRFATDQRGKCIRNERKWCTPAEFLLLDEEVDFTSWDRAIRAVGVPLKVLIEKGYLAVHRNSCVCEVCTEGTNWQDNDDECAICKDGGDLICCDICPRAFHVNCHIPKPTVSDLPSERWGCIFCTEKFLTGPAVNQEHQILNVLLSPQNIQEDNDDVCAICKDGGDLICCDICPRAFHVNCHIPKPNVSDSPSEKWGCIFCTVKLPTGPAENKEYQILNVFLSLQNIQTCEYLLQMVYCEDESTIFTEDPRIKVPNYSNHIAHPMWLNHVRNKLQNTRDNLSLQEKVFPSNPCYKTVEKVVRDMRLIFSNCESFNTDQEILQMGVKLSTVFEENLRKVFGFQSESGLH